MANRYYNVRIVGPPPAVCANIVDCTSLHVVCRCDNCYYRVRTSQLYKDGVEQLFQQCAAQENYPDAEIEVRTGSSCC